MKKFVMSVAAVLALTGAATAADMPVKAVKAPPPVVVSPWDIAFGGALMNDYVFRGVTQSNHKPSVAGYFEGRYNFNDSLQAYLGTSGESISFANRAAAEIDIYGGIRPTFGALAFDFGGWAYLYPGGTCFNPAAFPGSGIPGSGADCVANGFLPVNGNVIKRDNNFFEFYGKVVWTINDMFALGANEYYSPKFSNGSFAGFLNSGAWGNYVSGTAKFTAPTTWFGTSGVGMYVSGEFGRQWLGTSDDSMVSADRVVPCGAGHLSMASRTRATTPGTPDWALPGRCSRLICATPTPTCRRPLATPSPATGRPQTARALQRQLDQSGRLRFELVRCGRRCQALGRHHSECAQVSPSPDIDAGRRSNPPPVLFAGRSASTLRHSRELQTIAACVYRQGCVQL